MALFLVCYFLVASDTYDDNYAYYDTCKILLVEEIFWFLDLQVLRPAHCGGFVA